MKDEHSTTGQLSPEKSSNEGIHTLARQWLMTEWSKVESEVNRLQTRIAKATQEKKWNKVKRLSYLLTHSFSSKLLAVRQVTSNKGKKTPGIDGEIWDTPTTKMEATLSLTDKGYKAKPLRRVFIEKKGKNALRPLGIPCMYDRAIQALYALALSPIAETTADTHSFGFRKGRCAQDAAEYIFTVLSHGRSPKWILEGDICGCFDHINHQWLLDHIPMDKSVLTQFLKAGFIYNDVLFPTDEGTPQGGIISPILANMTLDGIQQALKERYKQTKGIYLGRYADDFIVSAPTKETAEDIKEMLKDFMSNRGLTLSEEKTHITNIDDGFDFLGWNFRKYSGKLLIKPSKKSVKSICESIKETVKKCTSLTQDELISQLNPKIRGWANYNRSVCSKRIFSTVDTFTFWTLFRWAKRRHPKKSRWWIAAKYWNLSTNTSPWIFGTKDKAILKMGKTKIVRWTKLKLDMNPYLNSEYFLERKRQINRKTAISFSNYCSKE